MSKQFPITRKAFGAFILRTKGKGSRRGDSDNCPLTRAIQLARPKAKNGYGSGPVTVGDYERLPNWAIKFMARYDGGASAAKAAREAGAIK